MAAEKEKKPAEKKEAPKKVTAEKAEKPVKAAKPVKAEKVKVVGARAAAKSYMAHESNFERKWYVVDATDLPLGRLASRVASVLAGKNKPTYTPNIDTGDFVIVVNCDKIALTGKKAEKKFYRHHTGYIGGLKEVQYGKLMAEKSDFALSRAIKGMLPKNSVGRAMFGKLFAYKGPEHKQQAQKPEALKVL